MKTIKTTFRLFQLNGALFLRDFRFYLLALFSILSCITIWDTLSFEALDGLGIDPFEDLTVDYLLGNLVSMIYNFQILVILLSSDIFSKDFKNRTIMPLVSTPIPRESIFLNRIISTFIHLSIAEIFFMITWFLMIKVRTPFGLSLVNFWISLYYVLLSNLLFLSLGTFFSLITKNSLTTFTILVTYFFLFDSLVKNQPILQSFGYSRIIGFIHINLFSDLNNGTLFNVGWSGSTSFLLAFIWVILPFLLFTISAIVFHFMDIRTKD